MYMSSIRLIRNIKIKYGHRCVPTKHVVNVNKREFGDVSYFKDKIPCYVKLNYYIDKCEHKRFHEDMDTIKNVKTGDDLSKLLTDECSHKEDEDSYEIDQLKPLSYVELFRFSNCIEWVLIFFGITSAWMSGILSPLMINQFGQLTNILVQYGSKTKLVACLNASTMSIPVNYSKDVLEMLTNNSKKIILDNEFTDEMKSYSIVLVILGCAQFALSYMMVTCLTLAAERQLFRIRTLFLEAILKQDMSWYDNNSTGDFASKVSDDLVKFQDGIGEKIGMYNFNVMSFICSVFNAFVHGWKLTLVMLSIAPIMMGTMAILGKIQTKYADKQMKAYAKAGVVAEEALSAIKTVVAFGGEDKEVDRYKSNLHDATKQGLKNGLFTSLSAALLWFMIYAFYALAFWYGVKLILDDVDKPVPTYDAKSLIVVFLNIMFGALQLGSSIAYLAYFSDAKAAGAIIFSIIDMMPYIDSNSSRGLKPEKMLGSIEFKGIVFEYPSRQNARILNGLEIKVEKGETIALVGESGCGKSTVVQLLQRFYDPLEGNIILDGCDIKLLNVGWLREHIGVVGQEPVLFGTTIGENIRYGWESATEKDIKRAAIEANAHDFVKKLPMGYDTHVGDRGAQLSGGQKQRIAIARALIRNPIILILDEATSALDTGSEAVVQAALDKARKGRTTFIIAHRLSTVQNADKIAVISSGRVAEWGTHAELIATKGLYYQMVTAEGGRDNNESAELINVDCVDKNTVQLKNLSTSSRQVTFNRSTMLHKDNYTLLREEEDEDEQVEVVQTSSIMMKILKYNEPEWIFTLLGCIGSFTFGFSAPAFSIIFGDILGELSNCDPNETRVQSIYKSLSFLLIGVITAISVFFQIFMLTVAGSNLTERLRKLLFAAMLRQEMTWYDDEHNNTGALCTRLSSDTASVHGATGSRIGIILQSICSLGMSSAIAFFLSWKLSAVNMIFVPAVLVASYLNSEINKGQSVIDMESLDKANKIATESITNIRTVASLHKERLFHRLYMDNLIHPHKNAIKQAYRRGFILGLTNAVPYFAYAACMSYGAYLVLHESLSYTSVFKVSQLLIMGTKLVGDTFAFAPNYNKAMMAAGRIFELLERRPKISFAFEEGKKMNENCLACLEFKHIKFCYPSRQDIQILCGFDLTVPQGKVIALVGTSGCGKSTCLQLLERFYEPSEGNITLDGEDIASLNLRWLRSLIGIVSQEPILFDRTIAENIAYGDNSRQPLPEEIIQAAMAANAHKFITELPKGYDTKVGDKGTQLSGGQKQRIAIARALIRNPKILLLDEATSALDTEGEKVVQEALERAQQGRTCIVVAHRLSTIRSADQIAVIHHGQVVEIGSHDELMSKMGYYYKCYLSQLAGIKD